MTLRSIVISSVYTIYFVYYNWFLIKNKDIFNIGYVTIKKIGDCYDPNSVNPLYLRINNASGYIKEINKDKYLIFDDTDKNKGLLEIYDDVFSGIMSKI